MADASVQVHAPIDAAGTHLVFERHPLLQRDERIVGADAHEDAANDVVRVLRTSGREPGVEPHDGFQIGARPGELEHHRPAEAVSDRGNAIGVGVLVREQHVEAGPTEPADTVGVTHERPEPGHDLVDGQRLAIPVVVERERDVAEGRKLLGATLHVVVEPRPFVRKQHGGAAARSLVVRREMSDHADAVDFVLHVFDVHSRSCQ